MAKDPLSYRNADIERLAAILPPDDCWVWPYATDKNGYGKTCIKVDEKWRTTTVHTEAYRRFKGEIAPGLCVRHSCDNPPCFNPAHLLLGTHGQNMKDRDERGRGIRGARVPAAKITDEIARAIFVSEDSTRALSLIYGIAPCTVYNIKARISWGHATEGLVPHIIDKRGWSKIARRRRLKELRATSRDQG